MCGIAGFIDQSHSSNGAASALAGRMLDTIRHRGPDNSSVWAEAPAALGHNRLSIIDLSDNANQPMEYGDLVITYNGEIYNYIEIKQKLIAKGYSFRTASDTEVILAAYREWGSSCVREFVGMWAFAIWNKTKKELFCSRDRFGIKPFYYIHSGNKFYFGSEYKPLKITPVFRNDLNLMQVSRGLQLGWVTYHDETYFEQIKQIPASCNLFFSGSEAKIEKYWELSPEKSTGGKTEDFLELFTDSIRLHMRSDVEVGACLSGGLDSSSIVSSVAKNFPASRLRTFTIFYEGKDEVDERPWVREVLEKYPSVRQESFSPSDADVVSCFADAVKFSDVPLTGSSPLSQYFVMKLASQHKMKVLLDGQGADEYLAGYMHSFYRLIGGMLGKMHLSEAFTTLSDHRRLQGFTAGKTADVLMKSLLAAVFDEQFLYSLEYRRYFPFMMNTSPKTPFMLSPGEGSRLRKFLYHLTFSTSLPSLLQFEDRNSMAFSIESRVPFLDHRLVEYAFSLPDSDKIRKGKTKHILREAMKHTLPQAIAERSDKKGFVTPGEIKWLRGCLGFLLNEDFSRLDFINRKKADKIVNKFRNGDNTNASLVWRLALLAWWVRNNA